MAFSVLTPMYTWSVDVARKIKARLDEAPPALVRALSGDRGAAHRPPSPMPNLRWRATDGAIVRGPTATFIEDLDAAPHADRHPPRRANRGAPKRRLAVGPVES